MSVQQGLLAEGCNVARRAAEVVLGELDLKVHFLQLQLLALCQLGSAVLQDVFQSLSAYTYIGPML